MSRSIFGWDLPPGCSLSDIPGNRPGDEAWEKLYDTFWNKERLTKTHIGIVITEKEYERMEKLYNSPKLSELVDNYIMAAIEYGMELGRTEEIETAKENKGYEENYAEERLNKKIYPESATQNDWTSLEDCDNKKLPSYWNDIDMKVVNQTMCPKCRKPMTYRGFWDKERKRYKCTFAVCYHDNFAISF